MKTGADERELEWLKGGVGQLYVVKLERNIGSL